MLLRAAMWALLIADKGTWIWRLYSNIIFLLFVIFIKKRGVVLKKFVLSPSLLNAGVALGFSPVIHEPWPPRRTPQVACLRSARRRTDRRMRAGKTSRSGLGSLMVSLSFAHEKNIRPSVLLALPASCSSLRSPRNARSVWTRCILHHVCAQTRPPAALAVCHVAVPSYFLSEQALRHMISMIPYARGTTRAQCRSLA